MPTEWPRYRSHKIVQATPIIIINKPNGDGLPLLFVDPSNGATAPVPFFPTEPEMARRAKVLDFAMIYRDGYKSVCPRVEFQDGYEPEATLDVRADPDETVKPETAADQS